MKLELFFLFLALALHHVICPGEVQVEEAALKEPKYVSLKLSKLLHLNDCRILGIHTLAQSLILK